MRRTALIVLPLVALQFAGATLLADDPPFPPDITWDRKDDQIMYVLLINAANDQGVTISGVQEGDVVSVTSASGMAYFSDDKGNPVVKCMVAIAAKGAQVAAAASGVPEAAPPIVAAEKFAEEQFKGKGKKKPRDPFGIDYKGDTCCQEGGVVICMPADGTTIYSGKNKELWIKEAGKKDGRTDDRRPAHLKYGFFLQRDPEQNVRTVRGNGQLHVLAWDYYFLDNAGYYKVFLQLKKGGK